ncbi:MAG: putative periplasmic protein [Cytophagales bacterium]|nr:hypothetical protein [Bacteroidota bacterium]MBS1980271.1 hypothetical protein [Bacteroidota bacterium]WHZ08795.1 MAG: putative periplasmic protein [Cytophagales bacterium]
MRNSSVIRQAIIFFLLVGTVKVFAQDTLSVGADEQYPFIQQEKNEIINATALSSFYEKLYQLKKTKKGQLNIVHIGDSHIQADFLTQTVRVLLQNEFGNAGRGFVFPGRVAHTNEPLSIYSSSTSQWEAKRIVYTNQPLPIGLGASTLQTTQPQAKFTLRIKDDAGLNYGFNGITTFYLKDSSSFNVALNDSSGRSLAFIGPYTSENFLNYSKVTLPYSLHKLEFQMEQPTPNQNHFTFFGVSLSNGNPGILYHAIGGNGAKYKHYLAARFFTQQVQALIPDLIIVSLGTNEAIENPVDQQFLKQAEELIGILQKNNPQAGLIITTPADFYRKRTRRNPGVESVHQQLLTLTQKKNTGCWDLYAVGGGKHSADQWRKNKLMQSDGIHFTRAGYALQGKMLYQALTKGYSDYVHVRYP